ncbi:MAG: C4-type zinc ribbon domain-containing protein, partial [Myxococcaceae bacterium]
GPTSLEYFEIMTIRLQLSQLLELGKKDQQLKELREKQKTLPQKANHAKNAALDASLKESTLKAHSKNLELKKSQLDLETQTEKGNLRKWEARADKIKGEREYTTLMSEIGGQKKAISDLETKSLQVMQEQDKVRKELESAQKSLTVANALYEEEWSKVESDMNALAAELGDLEQARVLLTGTMQPSLVKRYEQIASKRAGLGVSILNKEVCQACKRTVPYELFNRVAKGEVLESCPFCNRLLVTENLGA